jgi:glycosyltransferase involved in cell wall biosynthesis
MPRAATPDVSRDAPRTEAANLAVTVIMPVRNEGPHMRDSLEGVLRQETAPDAFEVLVVDGRSTDETREIVRQTIASHPNVRLLDNPGRIVPTAMNVGLAEARGEFIVRVDGHCMLEPGYIRGAIDTLRRGGSEGVGGSMVATGQGFWGEAIAVATSTPFGVGGARFHYSDEEGEADTVYLGAYRRDYLRQIGGYDPVFVRNQDDELNYRIRARGGRVFYTPRMRAIYQVRKSLRLLFRQYFQYGLWKVPMYRKTRHPVQPRHLVPATFVLSLLVPLILAPWAPWILWLPAGAIVLHLLAGTVFALRSRPLRLSGLGMPLVFLTLHVAYGSGFLIGTLRRLPVARPAAAPTAS